MDKTSDTRTAEVVHASLHSVEEKLTIPDGKVQIEKKADKISFGGTVVSSNSASPGGGR